VALDGSAAVPFANQIENPDPVAGTNNYYTQDGYGGGSYVNCADRAAPGVHSVRSQLVQQGVTRSNCADGHYYLLNNYSMYWNQSSSNSPNLIGATHFTLPPQSNPTIADLMTRHGVSWKYYSGDRGSDSSLTSIGGLTLAYHSYCGICDPLTGYISIMTNPTEEAKLQNYQAFLADVQGGTLPSVSFVRPFEEFAGHPANSNSSLYEAFVQELIGKVKANPQLWASTAIFLTMDEGGGYYDSGYVQPVSFFGDGTRIPTIAISPFAKRGFVDHTYYDHVSVLKFIEKNWGLQPLSTRSLDRLPNPKATAKNPYVPTNGPSVGDLMNLFAFGEEGGG
jgi:phospholipase C